MTVSVTWWLILPEVALIVVVYVPAGVPLEPLEGGVEDEPPQPTIPRKAKTIVAADRRTRRRGPETSSPEAPKNSAQAKMVMLGEKCRTDPTTLAAAVVATVTVTGVVELPDTLTELGMLQIGAGDAAGLILQVRFTVPLNDPDGVSDKLNIAVCPGEIVELDPPEGALRVKSGAATPVPLRLMTCGEFDALSVI
jgi:hypothetical protein